MLRLSPFQIIPRASNTETELEILVIKATSALIRMNPGGVALSLLTKTTAFTNGKTEMLKVDLQPEKAIRLGYHEI